MMGVQSSFKSQLLPLFMAFSADTAFSGDHRRSGSGGGVKRRYVPKRWPDGGEPSDNHKAGSLANG